MNIVDKIGFRGQVSIRALDLNGDCVFEYDSPNTITFTAPLVLLDLITQPSIDPNNQVPQFATEHPLEAGRGFAGSVQAVEEADRNAIRYMRIGSSNVSAICQQSDLGNYVATGTSVISEVDFPTNSSVRFLAVFDTDQANGSDIQEVSLWTRGSSLTTDPAQTEDSRMFARQMHPAISKTEQLSLEYAWTIYFT